MHDRGFKGAPEPTARGYKPIGEGELELWLQKESFEAVATKIKQAADSNAKTSIETNEEDSTVGGVNVYDDPEDRKETKGTLDAPRGEPGPKDPFHNSDGVWEQSKDTRRGVLDRTMSGFANASEAEKKLMSENFSHVADRSFETHSALLQDKTKTGSHHPTLSEQVKRLLGT